MWALPFGQLLLGSPESGSHWIRLKIVQARPKTSGPKGPAKHGCRRLSASSCRARLEVVHVLTLIVTDPCDLACYIKARGGRFISLSQPSHTPNPSILPSGKTTPIVNKSICIN